MRKIFFIVCIVQSCLAGYGQLVLPGDFPDPSVTKIGDTYWASATTSNWGPVFPLLSSKDLVKWKMQSVVFTKLPEWSDYYYWAPEISYDKGKVYVYYSAHKKDGNLCLSVASADKPEGPYTDLGPLMCQEAGSIDAFPMRDENGKLFLIWKEDGNSVGQPTPIWISEMKEDRTGLIGEKMELFRNDQPWEANLVEGVSIIKHNNFYYAFYAAAGCCGRGCTYATGIARAKVLTGPWEKFPSPILTSDDKWTCPGHGTPIEKGGRFYFLYHAYGKMDNVYTGRQGLLREFIFTNDGWVKFKNYENYANVYVNSRDLDEFKDDELSLKWQWPVLRQPNYEVNKGKMTLMGLGKDTIAFVGQKILSADIHADALVHANESSAESGIAAYGDEDNIVGVSVGKDVVRIWKKQAAKEAVLMEEAVEIKDKICLQIKISGGNKLTFYYSFDKLKWKQLNDVPVDGSFLPPWDRAVRVGLTSNGAAGQKAVFENFILYH